MSIKDTMQNFAINQALSYIEGNPDDNIPKLMALADKFFPAGWYGTQRDAIRKSAKAHLEGAEPGPRQPRLDADW